MNVEIKKVKDRLDEKKSEINLKNKQYYGEEVVPKAFHEDKNSLFGFD